MATFLCCTHIFVTAAILGQPEYHHVNCQWGDYWISKFEQAGFTLDQEATEEVRNHASYNVANFGHRFQRAGLEPVKED